MTYYNVKAMDYRELPAGTPGWQFAPVPGWGTNPDRSGPPRVGVGLLGAAFERGSIPCEDDFLPDYAPLGAAAEDAYLETSYGMVALGTAGGIAVGLLFGYGWWGRKRAR